MGKVTGHRMHFRRRLGRSPPSPTTTSQLPTSDEVGPTGEYSDAGSNQGSEPTNDECSRTLPSDPSVSIATTSSPSRFTPLSTGSATATAPSEASTCMHSSSTANPAGYINVAPLPVFRGLAGECAVSHLSRFARVCRANNALGDEEAARVFPVTLDGEAALWYELVVESLAPAPSWTEIRALFLEVYRRPEEELRTELLALRQAEGEGVYAYWLRMQWILRRWPGHGMPEDVLKGIFLDGMRDEVRRWVAPHRPGSTDDARRLAVAWEQAAARRSREARCGFCEGRHEESGCEARRRMRQLWLSGRDVRLPTGLRGDVADDLALAARTSAAGESEEKDLGLVGLRSTSEKPLAPSQQCVCWKHQCWKKPFERSATVPVQRKSAAE